MFELYQRCANRKQIEAICVNYLRRLEATKLSITGHMYFVPRTHMDKVDVFEEFIGLLGGLNRRETPLMVNSFFIIDDEEQRSKMTEEFYAAVKKEIATYQERADYLIKSGNQSPAVMERWVLKIQALEEKKKHYEDVLRREKCNLDMRSLHDCLIDFCKSIKNGTGSTFIKILNLAISVFFMYY